MTCITLTGRHVKRYVGAIGVPLLMLRLVKEVAYEDVCWRNPFLNFLFLNVDGIFYCAQVGSW